MGTESRFASEIPKVFEPPLALCGDDDTSAGRARSASLHARTGRASPRTAARRLIDRERNWLERERLHPLSTSPSSLTSRILTPSSPSRPVARRNSV